MTNTTTNIEPPPETDTPSNILLNLIIAQLAPMFLGVSAGDIGLARMAAVETVTAYRAHNNADLIAIAQIIAFGLAALGSLSQSLDDDISLSMALRLRGNANACNRSAEQNRRAFTKSHASDPAPHHAPMAPEPEPPATFPDASPDPDRLLSPAAEQELAAEALARLQTPEQTPVPPPLLIRSTAPSTAEKRHQEMWAIAMVNEASEITAGIANLPPTERNAASIRAATLSSTAHDLLYGAPAPPLLPGSLAGIARPRLNGTQQHTPPGSVYEPPIGA
jgi:hypothetical protein